MKLSPSIQREVATILGCPPPFKASELNKIDRLIVSDVDSLEGLAHLTALVSLTIMNGHLQTLDALAEAPNLWWLSLNNLPVADLSPVARLRKLTTLKCENLAVRDLSALKGMASLKKLTVVFCPLDEASQAMLAGLTGREQFQHFQRTVTVPLGQTLGSPHWPSLSELTHSFGEDLELTRRLHDLGIEASVRRRIEYVKTTVKPIRGRPLFLPFPALKEALRPGVTLNDLHTLSERLRKPTAPSPAYTPYRPTEHIESGDLDRVWDWLQTSDLPRADRVRIFRCASRFPGQTWHRMLPTFLEHDEKEHGVTLPNWFRAHVLAFGGAWGAEFTVPGQRGGFRIGMNGPHDNGVLEKTGLYDIGMNEHGQVLAFNLRDQSDTAIRTYHSSELRDPAFTSASFATRVAPSLSQFFDKIRKVCFDHGHPEFEVEGVMVRAGFPVTVTLEAADTLVGAKLAGHDLRDRDLSDQRLNYADLRKADLRGANLRGADLRGAKLDGARLEGADLEGCKRD